MIVAAAKTSGNETSPVTNGGGVLPSGPEQLLIDVARGQRPIRVLVLTRTRIDAGLWFRNSRVWAVGLDDALIALASGPRPYVQEVPYERLQTSFYSHQSGELVCVPAPDLVLRSLNMGPFDAWRLIKLIYRLEPGALPARRPDQDLDLRKLHAGMSESLGRRLRS